jgi:hypothetical protein
VIQGECYGVEAVASVSGQAGIVLGKTSWCVEGIAHEGMTGGREMDADLVGAAGRNAHFDERMLTHRDERMLVADLQNLDV